ncbi:RNA-binding S4 domain-containing protein [Natroniella sulfidigena]|uniref:RNA-binding S4 domain-containing protein n=1 Tax=Natroniella sulfidigena TaxID=723921 RepID=UPI00200B8394|nr:RNA-binding S4 domain-containing protein [Natroniella sulfidigena]MCK8816612.1 RNA-binding S4 domain-containing protein [Natroniella sulfidigena]
MEKIKLNTETIKLDQFLKWANLVSTGGEAKMLIQAGEIMVNQEIEQKRSRVLKADDIVEYNGRKYQIIT